ncbi:MAG: penicillin-binding protein 2 [Desulfobacteraceae bacterium]|nr:penicillin-binding protein 2 [Desulfobacteraceae bacterium]
MGFGFSLVKHYLKTADADWYRRRLNGALVILLVAFLALGLRLFHLQVVQGEEYRRLSENNCIRLQDIEPPRGQILDRQRRLLVDNRPSFNLVMVPRDAKPAEATLARLAVGTGLDPEELTHVAGRASSAYRPVVLRADIDRDLLAAVEARRYDLPGVSVEVKALRRYVYGDSGGHLIGYMGEINAEELAGGRYPGCRGGDSIGKFGIEKTCEHFLRGQPGGRQVEVDARGQVIRVLKTVDAVPGHDVVLTIDQRLQAVAEQCLGDNAGAVVAVDPNSGEVLAMASRPGFDPNAFVGGINRQQWQALVENPRRPMENKAIQATYPPASTYKIVTALAGLQEGVIDARSEFFCPGKLRYGNRSYRCWKRWGHGDLNVVEAISQSCDVFCYQLGIKLGGDRLARYARGCGLGSRTEVGLDHEDAGLIPTAAWKKGRFGVAWQGGENLSVAIGQGYNLVTPMQLAMMIAAVGNGGTLYRPQMVLAVESAAGQVIQRMTPEIKGRLDVSPRNMALVKEGLWRVVQGDRGTARSIRLEGIDISGKTGTAQVFSRKGETDRKGEVADHLKDHAWFVAYAPSEAPRIAVAVIIEHGEHGSSAAAPVARAVIRAYLDPAGAAEEAAKVAPQTDEVVQ